MEFELTFAPQDKDLEEIKNRVIEYNLKHFEVKDKKDIALFVREDEKIIAGITGKTFGNWLIIDFLFVDESQRGNSLGSKILDGIEKEAISKGCKYTFLNTFGFQAKEFYPKYGYELAFQLENYPITGTNTFYMKKLVK